MKNITILGASGSIGSSTLEILRIKKKQNQKKFNLFALSVHKNIKSLFAICHEFSPKYVCISDEESYKNYKKEFKNTFANINLLTGDLGLEQIAKDPKTDIVICAIVGIAGLKSTISAFDSGKKILLANKESMVAYGHIFSKDKSKFKNIIPIDSEHCAIWQCLLEKKSAQVKKIVLTASGGPFRDKNLQEIKQATIAQALSHPTWQMGAKISIDSATMMNKVLELIEARWLFLIEPKKLDAIIHKQSIIHGFVEFLDGTSIMQAATTDMKIPINYALDYPNFSPTNFSNIDFLEQQKLTFSKIDLEKYPCYKIGKEVLDKDPQYSVILNSANEIAAHAFLEKKINLLQIANIIEEALTSIVTYTPKSLEDVIELDKKTRKFCHNLLIKNYN